MAIQQALQTVSKTLLPEYTSRVILLTRDVVDDGAGKVTTNFGATVHPVAITYSVDASGNPTAVDSRTDYSAFDVDAVQLAKLFDMAVTLADGTVSTIGEVLSNFTDQIIVAKMGIEGTITTKHVNIT
jgi:hypothetical protein